MSSFRWRWRLAVRDSDLPAPAKLVAHTLACHMNARGGDCFPSERTLATETSLGVSTVRRQLHLLRDRGWLRTFGAGRGNLHSHQALIPESARSGRFLPAEGYPPKRPQRSTERPLRAFEPPAPGAEDVRTPDRENGAATPGDLHRLILGAAKPLPEVAHGG